MATWRDVGKYALALPGTREEVGKRGTRAWIVNEKFFVWERPLSASDLKKLEGPVPAGPILGVRTADLEMKDVLLAGGRPAIFTIRHFNGYPAVLVLLAKISTKELKELIVEAWLARAGTAAVKKFLEARRPPKAASTASRRTTAIASRKQRTT